MVQDRAKLTIKVDLENGAVESASWVGIKALGGPVAAHGLNAPPLLALQEPRRIDAVRLLSYWSTCSGSKLWLLDPANEFFVRGHSVSFIAHLR